MTTVIFGESGFIGRRLVDLLQAEGENVVCADLVPPASADEQAGVQYATHKVFNERQAEDYRQKHGMQITSVRPAPRVLKIIADVRADNGLPPIQTSAALTAPDSQPDRAPARTPHQ